MFDFFDTPEPGVEQENKMKSFDDISAHLNEPPVETPKRKYKRRKIEKTEPEQKAGSVVKYRLMGSDSMTGNETIILRDYGFIPKNKRVFSARRGVVVELTTDEFMVVRKNRILKIEKAKE